MFTRRQQSKPLPSPSADKRQAATSPVFSAVSPGPAGRQLFERTRVLLDEAKALAGLGVDPAPEVAQLQREVEALRAHVFSISDARQRDAARIALNQLLAEVRQLAQVKPPEQQTPPLAAPTPPPLFDGLALSPAPTEPPSPAAPPSLALFAGLSVSPTVAQPKHPAQSQREPLTMFDELDFAQPSTPITPPSLSMSSVPTYDGAGPTQPPPPPPPPVMQLQMPPSPPPPPVISPMAVVSAPPLLPPPTLEVSSAQSTAPMAQRVDAIMQRLSPDAVRAAMAAHHDAAQRCLQARSTWMRLVAQQEELCGRDDFAGAEALQQPLAVAQREVDMTHDARADAERQLLAAETAFLSSLESTLPQCLQSLAALEADVGPQQLTGNVPADLADAAQAAKRAEEQLQAVDASLEQARAASIQQLETFRADLARVSAEHAGACAEVDTLRAQLKAAETRVGNLMQEMALAAQRVTDADASVERQRADAAIARVAAEQALIAAQRHVAQLQESASNNVGAQRMLSRAMDDVTRRQQALPGRRQAIGRRTSLAALEQQAQAALSRALQDRVQAEVALKEATSEVGKTQQSVVALEHRCSVLNRQLASLEESKRNAVLAKDFKAAAACATEARAATMQRDAAEQEVSSLKLTIAAASTAADKAAEQVKAAAARVQACEAGAVAARLELLRADTEATEEALQTAVSHEQFEDAHLLQQRLDVLRAEVLELERQ